MTSTNRGLNRLILAMSGLLLLTAGTTAALVAGLPGARSLWESAAAALVTEAERVVSATQLGATGVSWVWVALLALLVLLITVLLAFIIRQGQGRTRTLFNTVPTDHGRTRIDAAFAEQALEQSLAGHTDFFDVHASTYRVNGASMLRVSVTARRGASPRDVINDIETSVEGLDGVFGRELPVLLHIGGGLRSRLAAHSPLTR